MRAWWGTTQLFVRETLVGLSRGAQHRYLLIGLAVGLVLLLAFQIGRAILHEHVYQTLLGRAGGARIWMDSPRPLKDHFGNPELVAKLRLGDGRRLTLFPYEDVGTKTLTPLGLRQDARFRGRLIPGDHPVGEVLRPVAGPRDRVLGLGFFVPMDKSAPDLSAIPGEDPGAVIYLALGAIPAIDWEAQARQAPEALREDYHILARLVGDCWFAESVETPRGLAYLFGETREPPSWVNRRCGEGRPRYPLSSMPA